MHRRRLGRHRILHASLAAIALAAGCASESPFEPWPTLPATPADPSAPPGSPSPDADAAPPTAALPPTGATVGDYVRVALQRNPRIRAARFRAQAARARAPQATSLDDPMLMVSPIGQGAQTATGEAGWMVGVAQTLPFPGKRSARGRLAQAEAAVAIAELRDVRLDVVTRVHHAFWDHQFASRSLALLEENRALLDQVRQAAEGAYRGGRSTQRDVLRASVELASLEGRRIALVEQRTAAAARLNALLDRPPDQPLPDHAAAATTELDLRLSELIARAESFNPTLAQRRREVEAARQRLQLASLERFPDLTVGLRYNEVMDEGVSPLANGDDQWWLEFTINLPIWSGKLDAMRTEARLRVLASLASLEAARADVAVELRTLLAQAQAQRRLLVLFHDTLTPQARQALDAALGDYRAGGGDFGTVVEGARQLLEFRRMEDQARTELQKRIVEVERVIADPARRIPEVSP